MSKMAPEEQKRAQEFVDKADSKSLVIMAANMAIISAAHAFKSNQITIEQFFDITQSAVQFIWCESSNDMVESFLKKEPEEWPKHMLQALAIGSLASKKAAERLRLLVSMCEPPEDQP